MVSRLTNKNIHSVVKHFFKNVNLEGPRFMFETPQTINVKDNRVRYFQGRLKISSVTESVVTEDEIAVKYMTAAMFASVLEDTITSIIILGKCNTALSLKETILNMHTLLMKKYDIKPSSKPEDPIRYPLDCDENKIEKMIADRELCLKMLITIYKEIGINRTYHQLQHYLQGQESKKNNELVKDVTEKRSQYREIKKELRSQRHVHRLALYDNEELVTRLIELIGDTEQMSMIKNKYCSDWKQAQVEQHEQKIHDAQTTAKENIDRNRYNFDREIRAHYEVERFNNNVMAEQVEKIDEIMEKYEEDIDKMDLNIQVCMSKLAAMQQQITVLATKFAQRQKEMEAWIKYKSERAAKEAQINRYHKAAIIVQAWWRGLLVRQKLGPFKKRTKGGSSKKSKKKRLSEEIEQGSVTQ